MTTIINTPNSGGNGDSGAGFVALLIVIILLVLGALFIWPGYMRGKTPAPTNGANINVTLPTGSGDTGGAAQ